MKAVRFSAKFARQLLEIVETHHGFGRVKNVLDAANALRSALAVKPAVRSARMARESKRLTHNEETAVIRAAVMARAKGRCECGCGRSTALSMGEMDHYAGRVRKRQSIQWCWWLSRECHRAKTDNKPDAFYWHQLFLRHAQAHGYTEAANYALNHIEAEELLRKAEERR